jgi:hypothetical protein
VRGNNVRLLYFLFTLPMDPCYPPSSARRTASLTPTGGDACSTAWSPGISPTSTTASDVACAAPAKRRKETPKAQQGMGYTTTQDAGRVWSGVYLGAYGAACNPEWLQEKNITHVISLCKEQVGTGLRRAGTTYHHFPIRDDQSETRLLNVFLRDALPVMIAARDASESFLVNCHAGRNR